MHLIQHKILLMMGLDGLNGSKEINSDIDYFVF